MPHSQHSKQRNNLSNGNSKAIFSGIQEERQCFILCNTADQW